jgi:hypothetical protein
VIRQYEIDSSAILAPTIFPISRASSPTLTPTYGENLTILNQTFTAIAPETVYVFSGSILARSHNLTLVFTSTRCTLNPPVSITLSIATFIATNIDSPGQIVETYPERCIVLSSGPHNSTFSAEPTHFYGYGPGRGLVFTFSDPPQLTHDVWSSATALWIDPIPTTIPNFVFGNQTLAFGEPVAFLNSGTEVEVVMTMDANGSGFVVAETSTVALQSWPTITPGPVPGRNIGGALPPYVMPAGGAQLVETNCCTVCQNSTQRTAIAATKTKTSGATPLQRRKTLVLAHSLSGTPFYALFGSLF